MTWPRLWWRWDRDLFLCGISAPGRFQRVRILHVVRGEARPQSWIIMIYGRTERWKKREREEKRKSFWVTSSWQSTEKGEWKYSRCKKFYLQDKIMCLIFHHIGNNHHSRWTHMLTHHGRSCRTTSQKSSDALAFFLSTFNPIFSFCIDLLTALKLKLP